MGPEKKWQFYLRPQFRYTAYYTARESNGIEGVKPWLWIMGFRVRTRYDSSSAWRRRVEIIISRRTRVGSTARRDAIYERHGENPARVGWYTAVYTPHVYVSEIAFCHVNEIFTPKPHTHTHARAWGEEGVSCGFGKVRSCCGGGEESMHLVRFAGRRSCGFFVRGPFKR